MAAAHKCSAKGWVESIGFKYLSAHNKKDIEEGVRQLLDQSIQQPVFLEVFSVINPDDINAMWNYYTNTKKTAFARGLFYHILVEFIYGIIDVCHIIY